MKLLFVVLVKALLILHSECQIGGDMISVRLLLPAHKLVTAQLRLALICIACNVFSFVCCCI